MMDMTTIQMDYRVNGFDEMKKLFPEILKEYGIEYEYNLQGRKITPIEPEEKQTNEQDVFFSSIIDATINGSGRVMSDVTRTYGYIAKLKNSKSKNISISKNNDELERA